MRWGAAVAACAAGAAAGPPTPRWHLPLDLNTQDASFAADHPTEEGRISYVAGPIAQAARFECKEGYVQGPMSSALIPPGTTGLSWGAWVRFRKWQWAAPNRQVIIAADISTGSAGTDHVFSLDLHQDSNRAYRCTIGDGSAGSGVYAQWGASAAQIDTWTHVLCSYNGNHIRQVQNFNDAIVWTNIGTPVPSTTQGTADIITVGAGGFLDPHQWHGLIDEVRIYRKYMTAAQVGDECADCSAAPGGQKVRGTAGCIACDPLLVWNLHLDGNTVDASSGSHHGSSTQVAYSSGKLLQAADFDWCAGLQSPLAAAGILAATVTKLTWMAWIRWSSWMPFATVISNDIPSGGAPNHAFAINGDAAGKPRCIISDGSTPGSGLVGPTTGAFNTGAWYHIACVYDTATRELKQYIDMNPVPVVLTNGPATVTATAGRVTVGYSGYSDRVNSIYPFHGDIDDVRIYRDALTRDQFVAEVCCPGMSPAQTTSLGPNCPSCGPAPTASPVPSPTAPPNAFPSRAPSVRPSRAPSSSSPTRSPTSGPTPRPTLSPIPAPTNPPSASPSTTDPSAAPALLPTTAPSSAPTSAPTGAPSLAPSGSPSSQPSPAPSVPPSPAPSQLPSLPPSATPSTPPSPRPSGAPTQVPTFLPSQDPSATPTAVPSAPPSPHPSTSPTLQPSPSPTTAPSRGPSASPTRVPTTAPTQGPSTTPSSTPTTTPTASPSGAPTRQPSHVPTAAPSWGPSASPTSTPTTTPTQGPSTAPSSAPTTAPTASPSGAPTRQPSHAPTAAPSWGPSASPTNMPTTAPTQGPSPAPSSAPTTAPTVSPSGAPTRQPSHAPTAGPSLHPSAAPSQGPSGAPTWGPSSSPTVSPTSMPSTPPSAAPSGAPTVAPSPRPTEAPSRSPTMLPTTTPSASPSSLPSPGPTDTPSVAPSGAPSLRPTPSPEQAPTRPPSARPTSVPSPQPSGGPAHPSEAPSTSSAPGAPTRLPSVQPSSPPGPSGPPPSLSPALWPAPTGAPSAAPTAVPTHPPPMPAVTAATAGAGEAAAVAGTLAFNPAAAAQAGRLILLLNGCSDQEQTVSDELPRALHPTQVRVSGFVLPGHAGCVLMGAILLTCVYLGSRAAALTAAAVLRDGATLDGEGLVHFPTVPLVIATILTQGTTYAGARLVRHASGFPDVALGVAAMAGGVAAVLSYRRGGRRARGRAVYKLDRQTEEPGCNRRWIGPGEWTNLRNFYKDRWSCAFGATLPGRHWVLSTDVALTQFSALNAGMSGGKCSLCGLQRIVDLAVALVCAWIAVRYRPYSRPLRTPMTVLAQVLIGLGTVALSVGYFSSSCGLKGVTLPGHETAIPFFMAGGLGMLLAAGADGSAALRVLQKGRRRVLDEQKDAIIALAAPGSDDVALWDLRKGLEKQLGYAVDGERFEQVAKHVAGDPKAQSVPLVDFFEAEDRFWALPVGEADESGAPEDTAASLLELESTRSPLEGLQPRRDSQGPPLRRGMKARSMRLVPRGEGSHSTLRMHSHDSVPQRGTPRRAAKRGHDFGAYPPSPAHSPMRFESGSRFPTARSRGSVGSSEFAAAGRARAPRRGSMHQSAARRLSKVSRPRSPRSPAEHGAGGFIELDGTQPCTAGLTTPRQSGRRDALARRTSTGPDRPGGADDSLSNMILQETVRTPSAGGRRRAESDAAHTAAGDPAGTPPPKLRHRASVPKLKAVQAQAAQPQSPPIVRGGGSPRTRGGRLRRSVVGEVRTPRSGPSIETGSATLLEYAM